MMTRLKAICAYACPTAGAVCCVSWGTMSIAQGNLDCASHEARQILGKTLRSRFAPPAMSQLEAMAQGSQIAYSVELGAITTVDSKPVFRQCIAEAFVFTNGFRQDVHIRYSLFVDESNRLILRTDEVTK